MAKRNTGIKKKVCLRAFKIIDNDTLEAVGIIDELLRCFSNSSLAANRLFVINNDLGETYTEKNATETQDSQEKVLHENKHPNKQITQAETVNKEQDADLDLDQEFDDEDDQETDPKAKVNKINHELICDYQILPSGTLFCTILTLKQNNDISALDKNLINQSKFKLNNLSPAELTNVEGVYKSHYYFAIHGNYLITAKLALNKSSMRLGNYISHLLKLYGSKYTNGIGLSTLQKRENLKLSEVRLVIFSNLNKDNAKSYTRQNDVKSKDNLPPLDPTEVTDEEFVEHKQEKISVKELINIDKLEEWTRSLFKDVSAVSDDLIKDMVSAELIINFSGKTKRDRKYKEEIEEALKSNTDLERGKYKKTDGKIIDYHCVLEYKNVNIKRKGDFLYDEEALITEIEVYFAELMARDIEEEVDSEDKTVLD
ncbi:hypothetical protein [Psittacicella hinzii]|uniref:Uncharacterized protein n=1 Tax=Psittacicella hinzii TaxID=2028575 RepID=A0A3A1YPA6_9GAMM|nr:hypothetical protein [Psittacicella hinzii]RIY39381.1 hypothetical protein CKF58_02260 [Psittacicella hinzii]